MTAEDAPVAALEAALGRTLSAAQLDGLTGLVDLLRNWDRGMNLVGEHDSAALWAKHIADSLLYTRVAGPSARAVDVGSGNGLPGLVMAVMAADCAVTLLEGSERRCDFLRAAAARLGLANVTVTNQRAEEAGRAADQREAFDLVVARRVAELPVLLEYALPLLSVGGRAVLAKGQGLDAELAAARGVPELLGGALEEVLDVEVPTALVAAGCPARRWFVVVRKLAPTPAKYPRRVGRPSKTPLQSEA